MMWIRRAASRHLTEDQLVALSLHDETITEQARHHTRTCEACSQRVDELIGLCSGLSEAVDDAAADALEPERLSAQRQRIARRLERLLEHAGPARVIRFPSSVAHGTAMPERRRWIAAAAVAGLLVGLVAGRAVYLPNVPSDRIASRSASASEPPVRQMAQVRQPADELAEEAFLLEVEAALAASRVAELQAIDAMTPRVLEATVSAR